MLDGILQRSGGPNDNAKQPDGDSEMRELPTQEPDNNEEKATHDQAERLKNLAGKVQDFVEGEGTLEGAKFDECVGSFIAISRFIC